MKSTREITPIVLCPSCRSEHLGNMYRNGECPIHNYIETILRNENARLKREKIIDAKERKGESR